MIRALLFLLLLTCSWACKDPAPVVAPKALLSEEKMAAVIADFALNDQMSYLNPEGNLELQSRYILKEHKVSAKTFAESYKYYIASPRKLESIMDQAQEIIKKKDPKAEAYINKKTEENGEVPAFAR
ncbi:DUF4296 domain-containing protein [Planobacterium oryzisoli]|uniref:DUF4296 domain-containing protein n=1 Tax=Planobacterium oryzisoli TaxID=2771435 RepID=A0A931EB74_9FLAO|nr:DUF4296 domain-containing protein [Planobacterium oryzisoli]MBF5026904.1 DUF4296 domain-containing protein [Planobacterium oryzisoli]